MMYQIKLQLFIQQQSYILQKITSEPENKSLILSESPIVFIFQLQKEHILSLIK